MAEKKKFLFAVFIFVIFIILAVFFLFSVSLAQTMPPTIDIPPSEALKGMEASPEFYQNLQNFQATPYMYPTSDVNPWLHSSWQQDYCNKTGMDFLVLIEPSACSPAVVRSDLLEEQDVPVLCKMTGVKINPLIQVPYIKSIVPVVENKSNEIAFVNFLPARIALSYYAPASEKRAGFEGVPTMNNLGYLWIQLKQQPVEEKMPEAVKANMSVKIRYDVARTYGINENQFVLPLLNQDEWARRYKEFGFWRGKGYLRLQEITGLSSAKIAVYSNPKSAPIKVIELREGVEPSVKDEVLLPGFYCGAGIRLKLEKITTPTTRARVMVNGNELLLENNDDILDSGCKVSNIVSSSSFGGSVTVWCPTESRTLTIKDYEARVEVKDPDARALTVTVGSNITIQDLNQKDKFKTVYVGFIGKEYSKEGFNDFMILFSRGEKYDPIGKEDKEKIIAKIHEYVKGKRGETLDVALSPETVWATQLRNLFENQVFAKNLNFFVRKVGIDAQVADVPFKIISVTGPEQVSYTKDIEAIYKESIQKWRDVAYGYATTISPEGSYYGVIALKNAAELAKFMHKRLDEAELLRELIDKYATSDEPEVINEVENAREELRRTVAGSGDRIASITRPTGSYFIELISIEKPGLGAQEAQVEINDTLSRITVDDEVDGWIVTAITENSVTLRNLTNYEETIAIGNWKYLGGTKVRVVNTVLRREAKVTVLPFEKERETIANFTVQIGIEKRAIKLSPEKTFELIGALNKQIAQLESVRDNLGKIVTVWKKACIAGATALWIKNFVTGLSGEAYARKIVMKPWTELCADSAYRKSIDAKSISDCYRIKEQEINKDVALVRNALARTNDFIDKVKSVEGVSVRGGLLGLGRSINDTKFMLEVQKNFPSELKGLEIYEERELRRITLADGRLLFEEKEYSNIDVLLQQEPNADRSKTAKLLEHKINSSHISGNITTLYENGRLSREDVKEIVLNLEIYKECKGKTLSEQAASALCSSSMKSSWGELKYTTEQVQELTTSSAFSAQFGINPVIVRPKESQILKAPVYTADSNFISNKIKFGSFAKMNVNDRYVAISLLGSYYIIVVEPAGGRDFTVNRIYEVSADGNVKNMFENTETSDALTKKLAELQISGIEEIDPSLCNDNEMKTPYRNEIKFWESGPYQGFVALMPIDVRTGWYMATTSYSGMEGALVAWKENADINTFWICNVGLDGAPNFDYSTGGKGDDCCTQVALITGAQYEIAGCISPGCSSQLIEKAKGCARNAITEFAAGKRTIDTKGCGKFTLGKPPAARPSAQCEDFMSSTDCKIMYNLCDPVMCPASRCDFGGRMPVDNVVQSGIIGSIMLCWPNFEDGRGVLVPVCLTGVHAGLDSFIGILKSGRDCLQEQLKSGKTVGICDQIMSVYKCEFFWKQVDPFLKAGVPALVESLGTRGGGEYVLFSESWKQSVDAARYFTDFYAVQSVKAFKARSTAQIGTEICKKYVSAAYPTQAKFWEEIARPESPTQATACFQEISIGGASPNSHYKIFAYIFAGRDQGVYYSIYLRRPSKPGYYEQFIPEEYLVKDGFGYLPAGEYLSISPDFTAPSGYKEIVIRLNEKEIRGFADCASTSFAIQELQNYYLEDQLDKEVKTAKECVSGKATIFPTATLNIQSAVENALEPQIYRRGILRVCSSRNPGESTEPERWKRIGYCGSREIGCWLDMDSVNESISDLGIRADIMTKSEEKDIAWAMERFGLSKPEESQALLDNAEPKLNEISRDVNNFIAEVKSKSKTELTKQWIDSAIKPINDKINAAVSELNSIKEKCARTDEKARAEFAIAKLYELRARLYAQPEVYLVDLEKIESGTCGGKGGSWMSVPTCPIGYEEITDATDKYEHQNEKCCKIKREPIEQLRAPKNLKEAVIVIDAGHGGTYSGATSDGVLEKDINFAVAKELERLLRATGAKVHMTRTGDNDPPKRSELVTEHNADLFISIHANAHDNKNVRGTEVWILCSGCPTKKTYRRDVNYTLCPTLAECKDNSERFKKSLSLANLIAPKVAEALGTTNQGVKFFVDFTLLQNIEHKDIPAVLVETAFMTNPQDLAVLKTNEGQKNAAIAIFNAIAIYFGPSGEGGTGEIAQCDKYTVKGKEECERVPGCWWDSDAKTPKCIRCPNKCEGARVSFWDWITGLWAPPDIQFKSKSACEKDAKEQCVLDCLWIDNECRSLSSETISKKMQESLSIEELTELKDAIETSKGKIKGADSWLGEINNKLKEIAPQPSNVFLVSRIGSGTFTAGNKLVNYDDSVEICAVIETDKGAVSYDNFRIGNRDVKKYTGVAPKFTWYNIAPIYQPFGKEGQIYQLPAYGKRNDTLQYRQIIISGDSWCIRANNNAGTYWYRVEVEIGGNTYSSLGRPASEACANNKEACITKYQKEGVDFNRYAGYENTLIEPDAFDNGGISRDVHRISRKSDYYKECTFKTKRCEFISTIEAFKNVPFAFGCSLYLCDAPRELGAEATACSPEWRHLSQDFIAIDCIDLMISALSLTTGKPYEFNDFNRFIDAATDPVSPAKSLEYTSLENVLAGNWNFVKGGDVEAGDILFVWKKDENQYSHTFVLYEDRPDSDGKTGKLDSNDIVVYTSYICPGSDSFDRKSKKDYDGQLCYAPLGRYLGISNQLGFSLVKVKDL